MNSLNLTRNMKGLAGWLLLAFIAAAVGGIGSSNAPVFYSQLSLPTWAPPSWLFGPVWTALYAMMGIASWLIWRNRPLRETRLALSLYVVQLGVNALWSWLFFHWQAGAAAFADIVLLWFLLVATIICFWRLHMIAATLLLPYLAWVSFAAGLAWNAWQMNPQFLG